MPVFLWGTGLPIPCPSVQERLHSMKTVTLISQSVVFDLWKDTWPKWADQRAEAVCVQWGTPEFNTKGVNLGTWCQWTTQPTLDCPTSELALNYFKLRNSLMTSGIRSCTSMKVVYWALERDFLVTAAEQRGGQANTGLWAERKAVEERAVFHGIPGFLSILIWICASS